VIGATCDSESLATAGDVGGGAVVVFVVDAAGTVVGGVADEASAPGDVGLGTVPAGGLGALTAARARLVNAGPAPAMLMRRRVAARTSGGRAPRRRPAPAEPPGRTAVQARPFGLPVAK
jgi:hypothetical protein